jgi:hypothetical protein
MIKGKTVFVLGAGASNEAGLPTGSELAEAIAGLLDIKFDHGTQFSGSYEVALALRALVYSQNSRDINPYLYKAWAIRDATPLVLSIDNFIDAHRGDEKIEICGKLGIARAILDAERDCKLYFDGANAKGLNISGLVNTWYVRLLQLLTEGVDKSQLTKIFENTAFIIFNYDRCLEHFLVEALTAYYVADVNEMRQIVKAAKFIHPYGVVGRLDWIRPEGASFGADIGGEPLLEIASQLKTFTEQFSDEAMRTDLQAAMVQANTIVFLGFAFHEQNMKLLEPGARSDVRRVFATAYNLSKSDCGVITKSILDTLHAKAAHIDIEIRNDLKCSDLFKQYWRALRAS